MLLLVLDAELDQEGDLGFDAGRQQHPHLHVDVAAVVGHLDDARS